MLRKLLFALLIASLFAAGSFAVRAQSAARAEVSDINTDAFPEISALLDVYDAQGRFISGLEQSNITVLEEGAPHQLSNFTEQDVGVHLVVAVNPGTPMDTRDALGTSRYERIVENLRIWAEERPADNLDEMSLVATAGPLIVNVTAGEWRNSLVSFQPNARAAIPSLQSLSFALDIAETASQPGMKRSILFLTPHLPDQAAIDTLDALTERAILSNIRVNVWLIDSENYFFDVSANALKSLALQTNGNYFAYSGIEAIPDPESYFAHLRHVYSFSYQSNILMAGEYGVAVQVQSGEFQALSLPERFSIDVQPPNPILVAPPSQILRQPPADDAYNIENLQPLVQQIEMMVEFPDGKPRPLVRTSLLLDGQIIAENDSAPFEFFVWDLSQHNISGEYSLQVEVVDSLGLRNVSLGVPITLTIVKPPTGIWAFFGRNRSAITIGVVVLAGVLLALILLLGTRRGLFSFKARRKARERYHDPVTQPIAVSIEAKTSKKRFAQSRWTRKPKKVTAPAYLVRLNGGDEPVARTPIPLTAQEMFLGGDPVKATYVLDDPSVSSLHARITQSEQEFIIFDENSVAGTWVNLHPVTIEGITLHHGDLIHFGLLRYRFEYHEVPSLRKPSVEVEEIAQ